MTIHISNISKQYTSINGQKISALNRIELNIKENEFLSIIGRSGSGKTTLIEIIGGLNKATTGQIISNGASPKIGILFQD